MIGQVQHVAAARPATTRRRIARWAPIAAVLLSLAGAHAARALDTSSEHAQPPAPEAERTVERLNDRLVAVLNDGAKDTAARERGLAKTLRSEMDFDTLARFVLGRYAAELTRDQRQTFRQTFADYVVETYARLLARNAIADMAVIASRKVTADTAAVASRVARRQGRSARWVWRMHRRDSGRWAVVDLQTPTASLAVNYRSEFGHLLDSRGFDALIQQIRTHTEREVVLPAENRAILMLIRGMQGQGAGPGSLH